jgi:hypothetical protein
MASDRVGLALAGPLLAVGTVDLDDVDVVAQQEAGETGAVGAGPLDADPEDRAEAGQPGHQLLVAGRGGGELLDPTQAADGVQSGSHMEVQVCVHAADDGATGLYDGHVAIPSVAFVVKGWHALAGTADGDRVA